MAEPYQHVGIIYQGPHIERRDPTEPLEWEDGWQALTALWTVPCFAAYGERQPLERRQNYTARDFTQAYTICWDMSTQRSPFNWAEELYRGYQTSVVDFVRRHIVTGMEQSASDDRTLILELVARWHQHKILIKDYSRAYVILDRYFVKHNGLTTLQQSGWQAFWNLGCSAHVRQRIQDALVHLSQNAEDYRGEGEPGSGDYAGALAGFGISALTEVAPEAAEQLRIRLRTHHGLDTMRIKDYGKAAGLQDKMLSRPFPGVLPLGPSQVSFFYRYHLQKLRVLSERATDAEVEGEEEEEIMVVDEVEAAAAVDNMEEEGGEGEASVEQQQQPQQPPAEYHMMQEPCRLEVVDQSSLSGEVLQEAVFGMGDDVFRALLDHLHVI